MKRKHEHGFVECRVLLADGTTGIAYRLVPDINDPKRARLEEVVEGELVQHDTVPSKGLEGEVKE